MKVKYIGKSGKINIGGLKPVYGTILDVENLDSLGIVKPYFQEIKEEEKEIKYKSKKKNKKDKK